MDQNNNNDNKIEALEARVSELENNWKRALADYKNLEKRTAEEKAEFAAFSNRVLVSRLLPILDNMELLEKHIEDAGIKLIVKELRQLLEEEGVQEVKTDGKGFDPETMEAIEMVSGEPGKVIEVTQRGYFLKNKLIRPARVKVGKKEE